MILRKVKVKSYLCDRTYSATLERIGELKGAIAPKAENVYFDT
ncbi:hypothetical protein [Crinalium epipsammum]|nr:hypothetical protein [Crinalium epipsammum]